MKPVNSNAQSTAPSSVDTGALLHKAHTVLLHYRPGATLPVDLAKVRAMLDAHMFGLSKRMHRDSVVEVAREIDQVLPPQAFRAQRKAK